MKTKVFAILYGALALAAGCVSTVNDQHTAGMPFVRDQVGSQYERSVDQVFQAARDVVNSMGTVVNESTLYGQTNTVKTVQGKVEQRNVWIRIEAVDPKPITLLIVQARTKAGGSDLDLAHEIDKQIALRLAAAR
jgi:hypothetical protein